MKLKLKWKHERIQTLQWMTIFLSDCSKSFGGDDTTL